MCLLWTIVENSQDIVIDIGTENPGSGNRDVWHLHVMGVYWDICLGSRHFESRSVALKFPLHLFYAYSLATCKRLYM
jgi:hypothetical protein